MKVNRSDLEAAAQASIITPEQAQKLEQFLKQRYQHQPSFNLTHVLYYMGGFVAISAMSLFMTLGWESFGGTGLLVISLLYAGGALALTHRFDARQHLIPAGICATFAVTMVPIAVYGIQEMAGFWPDELDYQDYHRKIKWHWIWIELATLLAGVIMARLYRYPYLVMPVAVTLWYMSMDLAPLIADQELTFELRALVSMYFGLVMLLVAFWVDFRSRNNLDYGFWLYLFGVMAFWCGMTMQDSDSELSKFFYFSINLLLILIGVTISRKVFVVFGAFGGCLYLGHLADKVFADSWLFPIALSFIGLMIIGAGIHWQKNEQAYTQRLRRYLPDSLQTWLDGKN